MSKSRYERVALAAILALAVSEPTFAQSYFEDLSRRSDVVVAIPFDSAAEVGRYVSGRNQDVDFDPAIGAMRFSWPSNDGGPNVDQAQVDIQPAISSGNVFVTWEERWGPNWASSGNGGSINNINTFKNMQYSDQEAFESGGLQLEVRKLNRKSGFREVPVPRGKAGYVDIRTYFGGGGGPGGSSQLNSIRADYLLDVEVWARYYLFIEYGGRGKISLWVSQENAEGATAVYRQSEGDSSGDPGEFRSFWFEHNSSQDYSGPTSHVWNRNFVVLDGVQNYSEAEALVELGSGPVVRPNPPVIQ
ncbi:MAG: hypothetical protein AAFZ58_01555 [Pseudomonadota bacterium]